MPHPMTNQEGGEKPQAATRTYELYLYYVEKFSTPEEPFFSLNTSAGMEEHGYLLVRTIPLTVELPDMSGIMQQRLAALEKEKASVRAAYLARVREIEERISKLQALDFTPA